jgi:outer membrane protein TolC
VIRRRENRGKRGAGPPFAALTLALSGLAGAAHAERLLTLEEAIAFALEKNEGIIVERESLVSARAAVTGAKGAYDPVLQLDGGWRRVTEPTNSAFSGAPAGQASPTSEISDAGASVHQLLPTGGSVSLRAAAARETTDGAFALLSPAYGTQVGVELRQPLLRDRAIDAARFTIRAAKSDRERAQAFLRREITETVAAVERGYWTLVAARREIEVREEAVRLAEEQLSETAIRIEKGAAPSTEIAQPRAELERRRGELFASREALYRAENAIKVLILADGDGALWTERLAPADDPAIEILPVDLVTSMERALGSRPELEAAQAVTERRRAEAAFARDAVRPSLDAVLSYDRFGLAGSRNSAGALLPGLPSDIPEGMEGGWGRSFGMLDEDRFDDFRAGLVFGIPIGNRLARAEAVIARSAERQADADLSSARKAVRAEVLDAAAALETAGQRIEAARAASEAAVVQLSSERQRYSSGLSTNFLVLTRQNDLSRARLDEIAALTDYRRARTEMARATGALLDERRIEVNAGEESL